MQAFRKSLQDITEKVLNFLVTDNNEDPSNSSSSEVSDCKSDCSFCDSANKTISMNDSSSSSNID